MSIVEILSRASAESGKNFLVIGGYAVNAHGYARVTVDLDFLANKADREFWKEVMLKSGYQIYSEQPNFSQFAPTIKSQQAVDFMLVNEKTFSNMHAAAIEGTLAKVKIKYPSLLHLIALKLHVIKQAMPHRELRDLVDVMELMQINHVDPKADDFKQLCEKFGNAKTYEAIVKASR